MTPIKIGFVLLSSSSKPIASTRIAALNMFPLLRAAGFDPAIVHQPQSGGDEQPDLSALVPRLVREGFRIVFFQKVHGESAERAARELAAAGVRTVYSVCDLVDVGMTEASDATITVADDLKGT